MTHLTFIVCCCPGWCQPSATSPSGLRRMTHIAVSQYSPPVRWAVSISSVLHVSWLSHACLCLSFQLMSLTLLVGRQEGHPACRKLSGGCWHGYLSGARCRLAYGPAGSTATRCLLISVKSRLVFAFWYRLVRVVLDKGPLNGCVCVSRQNILINAC